LLYISAFLLVIGLILLFIATKRISESGLPEGQIIFSDSSYWQPSEKVLHDPSIGLSGKPDYVIRLKDMVIPIEIKSNETLQQPYPSHILQLAAYCRLVDKNYEIRPNYGILHYPNRTFRIPYDEALERKLISLVSEMQSRDVQDEIQRSHVSPQRCRSCGYSSHCDQLLD
jgi:CRISPR-associated exonuclease Cas4